MADAPPPPSEQENPYLPPGTTPLVFDTFLGIDTSSSRPGIADDRMAWCDGFMPLGKNNLRTLPGVGGLYYDCGIRNGIVYFDFANLGSQPYAIIFLSDGSIQQLNTGAITTAQIAPPGTIHNPSQSTVGVSQWGSQYILIVADQTNGYFIWDGTVIYQSGTVAPIVTVTDSGMNYTSTPTIKVSGGSGSGATFRVQINGGVIENIYVVNPGSGYAIGDTPILTISGGGSDSTASATAHVVTGGGIQSVNVSNFGAQYQTGAYVSAVGGGGAGAQLQASFDNGQITGVAVINPGKGYTSAPAIQANNAGSGFGFTATAIISTGQIGSTTITSGGSGYVSAPTVTVVGDGVGATVAATISSGQVTALTVTNPGLGYTHAQLVFSGGNNAASATIDLMPFGVKGTAIETYQSRAWIVDGGLLQFTAPESLGDFATSDGGGFAQSTDSFLRVGYTKPIQTNGFLYLIADSSINYISGVQTSGVPATTTYTNQNADPEIGTPYPDAIDVFSRNIVFANSFGVHVSYGGAVTKISQALDGVYGTVFNFGGFQPSSAKAIIHGRKVWMVLLPVVDPISGDQINKIFMWNGKEWWSSQQDIPLTFIASQEIKSTLIAWGTDGQRIYPLFRRPSTGFTKTVQSKLWDSPGSYLAKKTASRFLGLAYYYSQDGGDLSISIDNENQSSAAYTVAGTPELVTWINNAGATVAWENSTPATVTWGTSAGTGIFVIPPFAVAQNGVLTGVTITTDAADMALISVTVVDEFWENTI